MISLPVPQAVRGDPMQRLPEHKTTAQLAGAAGSPLGGCGKMQELFSLCRPGTGIARTSTHYWLFFSLQTALWKPDLQDPRGSFLRPLQPEDSVSNSLPSAEPPLPPPPPGTDRTSLAALQKGMQSYKVVWSQLLNTCWLTCPLVCGELCPTPRATCPPALLPPFCDSKP